MYLQVALCRKVSDTFARVCCIFLIIVQLKMSYLACFYVTALYWQLYVNTQGMAYLHKSVFQSHGYLSSAKCHVDSRWVLKISGFSLHPFRKDFCSDEVDKCCFTRFMYMYIRISDDDWALKMQDTG